MGFKPIAIENHNTVPYKSINPCMLPLNVLAEIKHYPCKKVNDQWETDRQK
jgi:hypothetical protein